MKAAKFKKKELVKLIIVPEDVNKVKEVLKVLEPIEEDITLLGGEKFSTGSSVLPVLNKLKKRLAPDENDFIYIAKLKKDITEDMEKRCTLNLNKKVLAKSSFFDKRFDKLKFIEEEDRKETVREIEVELLELEKNTVIRKEVLKEPFKKKRFLGNGLSDSEDEDESGGAVDELTKYKLERRISSGSCPLEWWRSRRAEYPLMSRLARKYLSVQATSTAAERVMSDLALTLDKRRQSMKGDLFDQLMFLGDA